MPFILKIRVLGARNLPIMDVRVGFCVLSFTERPILTRFLPRAN